MGVFDITRRHNAALVLPCLLFSVYVLTPSLSGLKVQWLTDTYSTTREYGIGRQIKSARQPNVENLLLTVIVSTNNFRHNYIGLFTFGLTECHRNLFLYFSAANIIDAAVDNSKFNQKEQMVKRLNLVIPNSL